MAKVETVVVPPVKLVHNYVLTLSEPEAVALRTLLGSIPAFGGGYLTRYGGAVWGAMQANAQLWMLGAMKMTPSQRAKARTSGPAFLPGTYSPIQGAPNKQESAAE